MSKRRGEPVKNTCPDMDFIESDTSIQKIPKQSTKLISDFLQKEIDNLESKTKTK